MEIDKLSKKEKGYLFGLFEGDGYKIYDKNSRHYHVEFYLNSERDKEIINFLVRLLNKINLNPNLYQDKRYNCKRVRVYCKELFNILNKSIEIKDESKEFCIGYTSGMIDAEGYVNKKKSSLDIVNTNLKILKNIKEFLEILNVKAHISRRKTGIKANYRMYISVKFKSLKHLSIKAGKL